MMSVKTEMILQNYWLYKRAATQMTELQLWWILQWLSSKVELLRPTCSGKILDWRNMISALQCDATGDYVLTWRVEDHGEITGGSSHVRMRDFTHKYWTWYKMTSTTVASQPSSWTQILWTRLQDTKLLYQIGVVPHWVPSPLIETQQSSLQNPATLTSSSRGNHTDILQPRNQSNIQQHTRRLQCIYVLYIL